MLEAQALVVVLAVFADGGFLLQGPIAMAEIGAGRLRVHGFSFIFHCRQLLVSPPGD
jgi:hypothetical protein